MSTPNRPSVETAAQDAVARGAIPHVLDGSTIDTRLGMLDALAAALAFPDYFGRNYDALTDCLRDLPAGEHVLIWRSPQTLRSAAPKAYRVIREVLEEADHLTVVLAD